MKVLILVQSVNKSRYPELRKVQQETWDSVPHPHIKTLYYYPDPDNEFVRDNNMHIKGSDDWKYMFMQTMKAFRTALSMEWDFLFKTDNSAYVYKKELYKLLSTKPAIKFYGGHKLIHKDLGEFLWGEGVALSRDVVQLLVDEYLLYPSRRMGVEDPHIGHMLKGRIKWDESMLINTCEPGQILTPSHIYRCRGIVPFDSDIETMRRIHLTLFPVSISS